MAELDKYLISPEKSISEAIEKITRTKLRTLFVCNQERQLMGTLTEGDVLRFLLSGGVVFSPVLTAMNPNPIKSQRFLNSSELLNLAKLNGLIMLPIVDAKNRIVQTQSIWEAF